MNNIDQSSIARSLRSLMLSESSTAQNEMEKIMDIILKADYKEKMHNKEPIPPYLQNFCRICGTYHFIITTSEGLICLHCQSRLDERREIPERIKMFLIIENQNGDPIKKMGQLSGLEIQSITKNYTEIAKKHGYQYWRSDPNRSLVGGYYYKNSQERIVLSREDVTIKPKPVIRPTKEKA